MAIAFDILGLVAKVAVDRLTGSPQRTKEAIELFHTLTAQHDEAAVNSGFDQARREAADQTALRDAIDKAVTESGQTLSAAQRESIEFSVVSGLSSVPTQVENSAATVDHLVAQLLPGKSRSYVIWTAAPDIVGEGGAGRFCHFSYDGESYRVRDYIGGNIFHPSGRRVTDKLWHVIELKLSAAQIWNASKAQLRCTTERGLYFPVTDRDAWRQMLMLLTEVANQFQS